VTNTTNYGSVNTQITRQDPNIEKYRRALLADVQQFIANQVQTPQAPPAYQVAGLGQPELDAISLASQGVGQYAPYLQGGANAIVGGQNYIQQGGLPALQQAMSSMGGGQQFINQAAQLANNTRNIPYAYQAAANQGIQDAVQLGTGMGADALGQLQQSTALGSTLADLGGESRRFGFDAAADIANQPGASVGSTQSAQNIMETNVGDLGNIQQTTGAGLRDAAGMGIAGLDAATAGLRGQAATGQGGITGAAEGISPQILAAQQGMANAADMAAREAAGTGAALGGIARGAQDIAGLAGTNLRALNEPLSSGLGQATTGARSAAATGQQGAATAAQNARQSVAAAQQMLSGTTGQFDPGGIGAFMSQYEDQAVQQALADLARQGDIQQNQLAAQAVGQGAFGGSRSAIAEAENRRNVLEQQGRTAAQMRAAGFTDAATRAQNAFEQAQGRGQSAATQMGNLGLSAEQLAQTGSLQGAQLGMSAEQQASANQQAIAQTGMSIEQLAASTGMSAQQLAGQFAGQAGQMGMSAAQQAGQAAQAGGQLGLSGQQGIGTLLGQAGQMGMSAEQGAAKNAAQMAQLGMNAEQIAGQLGISIEQAQNAAAQGIASLGQGQARLGLQGSQAAGQMGIAGLGQAGTQTQAGANIGMQGGQAMGNLANQMGNLGLQGAQQQGNLGLQFGQLGQADIAQLLAMGGQQQNLGQGLGALAGQYGQFGTQLGNLGGQQANIGSMLSGLSGQDLSNLITTGALERGVRQSGLDATRLTTTAQQAQPYQQYGFLSDIYMGVPTSQQVVTATSSPQVSPFQTALGLGIQGLSAAGGARNAGLF